MKKIHLYCLLVAMIITTSCSQDVKMERLLEQIPANTDVVFVGSVKTVVESAGGSLDDGKIKLPSDITSELPNDVMDGYDEANDFLRKMGVDPDACAIVVNFKNNNPIFVFSISDKKKFLDAIDEEGFRERGSEEDVTIYKKRVYESSESGYDDYGYIAVNGSYGYWIESVWEGSNFKPAQYLQRMIDDAGDNNFADTKYGEYLTNSNVGGVAVAWPKEVRSQLRDAGLSQDLVSIFDGTICLRGSLTDDKATVEMKLFDRDGNEINMDVFQKFMDTSATINGEALALLGKNENFISAVSLKNFNWDKYMDLITGASNMSRYDRAQLDALISYLEKIDGTVAVGFGLTDGLESIINLSNEQNEMLQFSATIVVETKDGKAKKLIDDMKGFLEQSGVPFTESQSGLSVDLANIGTSGSLYAKSVSNFVVLANHPISDSNSNDLVSNTDFTNYLSATCIGLDRGNRLMRDLHVDDDVKLMLTCKPQTLETSMTLEIKGEDKKGLIAKAAHIILGIVSQSRELDNRFNENRNDYEYGDTIVVDPDTIAYDAYPDYPDSAAYAY